jgi:hypothetical protein
VTFWNLFKTSTRSLQWRARPVGVPSAFKENVDVVMQEIDTASDAEELH